MKVKILKLVMIAAIIATFSFSVISAYADNTTNTSGSGTDVLALAANKVMSLVNENTTQSGAALDSTRIQVENDIVAYVNGYIKGLQDELKAYTDQQVGIAQGELDKKSADIKNQLDSARQGLITNAEQQIQQTINNQLKQEQDQMNSDLDKKLKDSFK